MTETPVLPSWAASCPLARLATVGETHPHIVPVVFCEVRGAIYVPIDGKPKSGRRLQRLRNIDRDAAVCLLVDVYDDDWSRLRWVRVDGRAERTPTTDAVAAALRAKYPQYVTTPLGNSAIRITVDRVRSWRSQPDGELSADPRGC
ncbi:MAG: TIGR03668 family PPOX class F420-dependent oxidoreductase [Gammaproteobacteria bacterium]|nr:TIGR03668 family PPOX class F420-dependent oxidoreductase [Gammaproteobacteria bacterium]